MKSSFWLLKHELSGRLSVLQLGVMTYTDLAAQSPETQAAVEQEVRVLLKVGHFHWLFPL